MSRETTMAYINDIATRVNDPAIYGGASLMVGAGFSKNAEGIGNRKTPPDWSELAKAMYDELYPKPSDTAEMKNWKKQRIIKTSGKNTLRLAEEYIAFFDRNKMNALIEKNVADEMFIPGEIHKRLLRLNWTDIFTTNYDTLLERAREDIFPDKDYRVILSQDNLPGSSGGIARIIKLHGSIPGVRPYIISEEDFRCYPRKSAAFVNTVQQSLIETTLCMVGFSGDDPNFLSWHGWLHDNLGENCPQVYLIGLFSDMNESEKDILRNRKIALVDLTDLLDGSEKDKYSEAYNKFIDFLEVKAKKESFKDRAPFYGYEDIPYKKLENEDDYIKQILEFSEKILEEVGEVVLLPKEERDEYRNYFQDKFNSVLSITEMINNDYLHLIANLIRIQRLCLIPLYDYQANKLIKICDAVKENNISFSAEWMMQIYLYLLEMYRVDSDEAMYQDIILRSEQIQADLSDVSQGLYHIELAKHAASFFDGEEVKKQLANIGKSNLKIEIAKAGLFVQLGDIELAEELLKECLSELRKMKMESAFNASYKSYLSLCYNTLNKWWNRNDDYSDIEYKGNRFQTRRIIIELEQDLREEILKERVKDDTRENVFDVNYSSGKTILIGENRLQRLSFEFILMLDALCLPLFSDQSFLVPSAIRNIMSTSANTYWKSSFMVRANNKDVIERAFSRRSIAMSDIKMMTELYNNIWNCVQKTVYKGFDERNTFLSHNNALNVLSRIVVFLDDDSIIELMKHIAKIDIKDEEHIIGELRGIISRLSTRFNGKIAEAILDVMFIEADSRLCMASFFSQLDIKFDDSSMYYTNAIELIKKERSERDNGIAQLLCLWRNCPDDKYKFQIADILWNNNTDSFPDSKMFYEMIWEELPHPDIVDFAELYKNYIYDGLVYHVSDRAIFRYINLFYLTSSISDGEYTKIDFENTQLIEILCSIEHVVKEKKEKRHGIDFFGEENEAQQIRYVSEFIAMVYVLKVDDAEADDILEIIERILLLIKDNGANGIAMDAIKCAIEGNYSEALGMIKSAFWSNDEKAIGEASLGLQLILFVARKKKQGIMPIKEATLEIMDKLQYSDIKYVKSLWNLLRQPILKILSDDECLQDRIAEVYKNCIRSYSYNGLKGDKYYFEAMYNCNKTLKGYIDELKSHRIVVGEALNDVIEFVKSLNVPELSSVWI